MHLTRSPNSRGPRHHARSSGRNSSIYRRSKPFGLQAVNPIGPETPASALRQPSAPVTSDEEQPPRWAAVHVHALRHDQALEMVLFSTPPMPILVAPVATQATRRRTTRRFNLSNVHRSSRLASKQRLGTMMHRAQEALAHKMGMLPIERTLTEDALKEYLTNVRSPSTARHHHRPLTTVQDGLIVHIAHR